MLIRRELTERAKDFSLILDDVAITELSFSREYTAAVEAKQVGELREDKARVSENARGGVGSLMPHICDPLTLSHHSSAGGPASPVFGGKGKAGTAAEDCAGRG